MNKEQSHTGRLLERIVELILNLIFASGGALLGALFGALFLPGIWATVHSLVAWGPEVPSRMSCAILAAAVGAIIAFCNGMAQDRRRRRTRRVSQDLDLRYSSDADTRLEDHLRQMFDVSGFVDLENVIHHDSGSGTFLVGDVNWSEHRPGGSSGVSGTRTVTQTIAYFESDVLLLPEFLLQPQGWLLNMFCSAVGIQKIEFDEHPEFSRMYHLTGVSADSTRLLFSPRLLEYFCRSHGWEVRGQANRLVLCRPGERCDPDQLPGFIQRAIEVFELFREAAAEMKEPQTAGKVDARSVAEIRPSVTLATATAQVVTRGELDVFLDESPPRRIPANIRRQRIAFGSLLAITLSGMLTMAGGIFVASSGLLTEGPGDESTSAAAIGIALASVGLCALFMSLRYRRLKIRLLRMGIVTRGMIEAVERTEVVINHERRYRVSIRFEADGSERVGHCAVYGKLAGEASRCAQHKVLVRVLYDRRNPSRIVWAESLATVSPAQEGFAPRRCGGSGTNGTADSTAVN